MLVLAFSVIKTSSSAHLPPKDDDDKNQQEEKERASVGNVYKLLATASRFKYFVIN